MVAFLYLPHLTQSVVLVSFSAQPLPPLPPPPPPPPPQKFFFIILSDLASLSKFKIHLLESSQLLEL